MTHAPSGLNWRCIARCRPETGRQIEALVRKVNAKPNNLIFGE